MNHPPSTERPGVSLTRLAQAWSNARMDQDLVIQTYSPAKSLGHARRRAAIMLVVATGISVVPCVAIFAAVLYGDWMTEAFASVSSFMFRQPVWAILAATSPLAAALLVGYGYMQRAIRRRGAAREQALDEATRS